MKKLAVFIFLIIILCCTNLNMFKTFTLDTLFPDATVEVYVEDIEVNDIKNLNYIQNGTGKIVFLSMSQLEFFLSNNEVFGYTIKIKNKQLNDIFKVLSVKNVDYIQGAYYGKSEVFDKRLNLYGTNYNFECVKTNDYVLLGTPILLGSY